MPINNPSLVRMTKIDNLIRKQKYVTMHDLLEVTEDRNRKTVYKTIEYMRETQGAPIEYDNKNKWYYYTEEDYQMRALYLNEGELFTFLIANKVLEQYKNMPFYGKMVRIFERIRELLPDEIKFNPDELSTAIHFQLEGFANYPPDIFDTLTKGIKDSWAIEIEYSAITNEQKTRRIIQPYFIFNKHGDWYVYAFCKLRGEYRLFALHRIKTAKLTNEIFLKKKIDPKKVIGEHLDQPTGKGKYDVEIFIKHPTSLYVSERQLHSTQKIVNHHDGSLTISFTVNSLRETTRWILSMGSDAIVKKPKLLQNIIKEEIEIMVENYSK